MKEKLERKYENKKKEDYNGRRMGTIWCEVGKCWVKVSSNSKTVSLQQEVVVYHAAVHCYQ